MKKILYGVIILLLIALLVFAYKIQIALATSEPEIPQLIIDHPDTCREASAVIFKDAPIMLKVMKAESGGNHLAKNKNSTASGCFQILKSTWKDARCTGDVFHPIANTRCARKLYDRSRLNPWLESKPSWSRM